MDKNEMIKATWGIDTQKKQDTSVAVWVSPNVRHMEIGASADVDDKPKAIFSNTKEQMGFASGLKADERINRLVTGVDSGKITTVQDAIDIIGVQRSTILKYMKTEGLKLRDEETKTVIDFSANAQKEKTATRYYDGDPEKGGRPITRAEHLLRVAQYKAGELYE